MGNACCKKDDGQAERPESSNKSKKEVNPFKPGPRNVRIVQNEETGKLEKTKYKPPSNPNLAKSDEEVQSLVTHSLLSVKKAELDARSKPNQSFDLD